MGDAENPEDAEKAYMALVDFASQYDKKEDAIEILKAYVIYQENFMELYGLELAIPNSISSDKKIELLEKVIKDLEQEGQVKEEVISK